MQLSPNCAICFAGLSCGARIKIVNLLKKSGELSVSKILKHFEVTQPTISHHLSYLKKTGVIKSRRAGREMYYSINPKCRRGKCNIFYENNLS